MWALGCMILSLMPLTLFVALWVDRVRHQYRYLFATQEQSCYIRLTGRNKCVYSEGDQAVKCNLKKARQGKARQGEARQGEARQGEARQGEARQGEASKRRSMQPHRICKTGCQMVQKHRFEQKQHRFFSQ